MATPFASGTLSLALYPEDGDPAAMLDGLFAQAEAAEAAGLDGVTISEHHGGFSSYLPNPLQASGWVLERTDRIWAGPCPLLLPLRPTAVVAEELAWMAALHPGRVGAGVAPGYAAGDFDLVGADFADRAGRFFHQLGVLGAALRGHADDALASDPAVAALGSGPVPLVAAAGSVGAAERAARAGVGVMTDSMADPARIRRVFQAYDEFGGTGPRVLNRRVWVGELPTELVAEQAEAYRRAAGSNAWMPETPMSFVSGDEASVAAGLADLLTSSGATHLGLKVHVAGVGLELALEQIAALAGVVDLVRGRSDHRRQ